MKDKKSQNNRLTELGIDNKYCLKLDDTKSLSGLKQQLKEKFILSMQKLGELEDLLEKYKINSIEDLELRLEDIEHYAYQCYQQLERELESEVKVKEFWHSAYKERDLVCDSLLHEINQLKMRIKE